MRFAPGLNPDIVKSTIQDSYLQLSSMEWNRLKYQHQIYTVVPYSTGTVTIDSTGMVTPGGAAVFDSTMVGRFMKVYYDDAIFEIVTYTPAGGTLTLRGWPGATLAVATTFEIIKTIYELDAALGIVFDITQQVQLKKKSQDYFNRIDPARATTGSTPYFWAYAGINSTNGIKIEIYPVPTTVVMLRVYGKFSVPTLAEGDVPKLPEELIKAHALLACYELKDVQQPDQGWGKKLQVQAQRYANLLEMYQDEDHRLEAHRDRVKDVMAEPIYPLDDSFGVSHDVD